MEKTLAITVSDGTFSAYVVKPKSGSGPVVVLLQEAFGVNAGIRYTAGEIAKEGFVTVCPDLYWRVAPGIELSDHIESETRQAFEIYDQLDIGTAVDDVYATVKVARPLSSTHKVGVMGFCLGGLLTTLMSARHPVDAAVSYYGGGTERYVDELGRVEGPLLMHLAGSDEYMAPAAQKKIQAALSGCPLVEIDTYPQRQHAFARHGGDHYNAADASLAKQRTVEFFRKYLVA
jgi:carboxymethylenebutenolidase